MATTPNLASGRTDIRRQRTIVARSAWNLRPLRGTCTLCRLLSVARADQGAGGPHEGHRARTSAADGGQPQGARGLCREEEARCGRPAEAGSPTDSVLILPARTISPQRSGSGSTRAAVAAASRSMVSRPRVWKACRKSGSPCARTRWLPASSPRRCPPIRATLRKRWPGRFPACRWRAWPTSTSSSVPRYCRYRARPATSPAWCCRWTGDSTRRESSRSARLCAAK